MQINFQIFFSVYFMQTLNNFFPYVFRDLPNKGLNLASALPRLYSVNFRSCPPFAERRARGVPNHELPRGKRALRFPWTFGDHTCAREVSARTSRKSIGGGARASPGYLSPYLLFFVRRPAVPTAPQAPPPPHVDTRETFAEDSPWDRCPFPPRSCALEGGERQFGNSGFGFGGDFGLADRPTHDGIGGGNFAEFQRWRRELAVVVNDNAATRIERRPRRRSRDDDDTSAMPLRSSCWASQSTRSIINLLSFFLPFL